MIITNIEIPDRYSVCEHSDCKLAATCLYQIAYVHQIESETYLRLINPRKCSKDGNCLYYRDSAPVTFARGFTNFQKRMFPDQYQRFMTRLIGKFGRNPYFERRRGDTPLPPKEQEFILNVLKEVGITEEMKFDQYEENINWYG